jgi:hypothetical protein
MKYEANKNQTRTKLEPTKNHNPTITITITLQTTISFSPAPLAGADCVRFVEILPRLFEACKMEQRARFAPIRIQNIPS